MDIRRGTLDDVSSIVDIENSTNAVPWTELQFISSIEVGHHLTVSEIDSQLIGFAIYSPIIPEAHLLNIAISLKHQRNGLGRILLQHIIDKNKLLGAQILTLEVRISNHSAIFLYESMGFKKDAIRPLYYRGDPKEDALLMSLKL